MASFKMAGVSVALGLLCIVVGFASTDAGDALDASNMRIRKELRTLSDDDFQLYVKGLTTMLTVSTEVGQQQYGPAYKEYEYFIVKHATASEDSRGDQAHGPSCFLTFHRSLVLEFENSILSVVPKLGAIPYWDWKLDVTGAVFGDPTNPKHIFSNKYAGSVSGNPDQKYAVTDGLFPNLKIGKFNATKYGFQNEYSGNSKGLLRGSGNDNDCEYLTRYPYAGGYDSQAPFASSMLYPNPKPNEFNVKYDDQDWETCVNPADIQTWMDWEICIDMAGFAAVATMEGDDLTSALTTELGISRSVLLHTMPYSFVGGSYGKPSSSKQNWASNVGGGITENVPGDFLDISTSPNEVFLFMLHHANVDRSNMIWQANYWASDSSCAANDTLWYFPKDDNDWPAGYEGCYLDDVISSKFPFVDIFPDHTPANGKGYTHREVLWYTRPEATGYTYETLVSYDEMEGLCQNENGQWGTAKANRKSLM